MNSMETDVPTGPRDDAMARARQEADALNDALSEVKQRAMSFVRERPGTALLVALGAGLLVGRIVRR